MGQEGGGDETQGQQEKNHCQLHPVLKSRSAEEIQKGRVDEVVAAEKNRDDGEKEYRNKNGASRFEGLVCPARLVSGIKDVPWIPVVAEKKERAGLRGFVDHLIPLILYFYVFIGAAVMGFSRIIGIGMLVSFVGTYIYLGYFSWFSRRLGRAVSVAKLYWCLEEGTIGQEAFSREIKEYYRTPEDGEEFGRKMKDLFTGPLRGCC